ncbi:hypothetical protein [Microtetraspora malaysiensis]|uniref:hypothetical protein n=1 Tax=Microtetraspora malaysiensis TaxID=161358 RepID=UPI003D947E8A
MTVDDHLTTAVEALSAACADHAQWSQRTDRNGRTYVGAGRDTVKDIDDAIAALHGAREVLIGELRADDDERAARVDALAPEDRGTTGEAPHPMEDCPTCFCCTVVQCQPGTSRPCTATLGQACPCVADRSAR